MEQSIQVIKNKERVPLHRYWMVTPDWYGTLKPGDCSLRGNATRRMFEECLFTHPHLPDSADPFDEKGLGLVNDMIIAKRRMNLYAAILCLIVLIVVFLPLICLSKILCSGKSEKVKVN